MKVPRYTPEGEFYRDADGYDLAQDSRWEDVDPSMFGSDVGDWPRPYRSVWRPAVCREDFDPAGLPKLPPDHVRTRGARPAPSPRSSVGAADARGTHLFRSSLGAPAWMSWTQERSRP